MIHLSKGSTPLLARHLRTRVRSEVLGLLSGEDSAVGPENVRRVPHLRTRVRSEVLGLLAGEHSAAGPGKYAPGYVFWEPAYAAKC